MKSLPIKIKATGIYAPGAPISNLELKQLAGIDFDHEKTEAKLGIAQRHIARLRGLNESTADFATKAALHAIQNAGIDAQSVGLFIVGTDTPEFITPATSILVQGRIQNSETWASTFDVAASCASFTIALDNAVRIMATDESIMYAVVVGVYNMPAFIRNNDAFGLSIFADGAGAVVLERSAQGDASAYLAGQLLTDGTQHDFIGIYSGGAKNPVNEERLKNEEYGLQSLKPLPGDRNVRLWPMVARKLAQKAQLPLSSINHFLFTQINKSVIVKVMEELQIPLEQSTFVMQDYGYTGSGCIPMALHRAIENGSIKRGDSLMMIASGAGLAVGSNLLIY